MIKPRRLAWPNPADTALDRARAIARDLHRELAKYAPEKAQAMARAAAALGEPWLEPVLATGHDDDWVLLKDAAADIGGTADQVYKWTRRGPDPILSRADHLGRTLVRLGDVRERYADQRQRRAERRV